ncbi:hypothetical protein B1757_04165 [Acidithiobacillus marinus]|uniref:Glycosyl transferase n=1 Tax=Acidithiobacillus marinus TaxID=187490 RepID=A0A2I1DNG4_9PROT|nr:glycosyltransferase family 4 protein [Acidithiobacillus marinus]PKY11420.1 hypothetical protein B1757_04165 [Acidithiobacillus marinus]
MKTLCMITHKLKKGDGQGRVNYEILLAAHAAGYAITLLASECTPEVLALNGVSWVSISVRGCPSQLLRNQIFALRTWWWLTRHAHKYNLIHANGFITWYPADVNSAHFVHGAWRHSPYNETNTEKGLKGLYHRLFTWLNAKLERYSYRQARWVTAVSPKVAEELMAIGVDSGKIMVIPNGVDIQEYCPGMSSRHALGLKDKVPAALFAGDLRSSRKNLDTVFHALVMVKSWHLVVLGYLEKSPYPELAKEMGIADRVHFMGYREDVPKFLRSVDLLVFPSRYDPWAMIVSEALACAVPVITAKTVGAAFQIPANGGWVLDDPDDFQAIATILENYAQMNADMKVEMASVARASAIEFAWSRITEKYLEVYDSCLQSKPDIVLNNRT